MSKRAAAYFSVIVSAVLFGLAPIFAKALFTFGFTAFSQTLYRNLLPIPILIFLIRRKGQSLFISAKDFKKIASFSALGYFVTPALLFTSYQFISSGLSTCFHYIYPAVVAIAGAVICHEKLSKTTVACLMLCMLGVIMFYTPGEAFHFGGAGTALLSGFTYASCVLIIANAGLEDHLSSFQICLYACISASVLSLILCLLTNTLSLPSNLLAWVYVSLCAMIMCIGAQVLFQKGAVVIGGSRASILSALEPITSIIAGFLIFQEEVTYRTLFGAACIVCSTILIAVIDKRSAKST